MNADIRKSCTSPAQALIAPVSGISSCFPLPFGSSSRNAVSTASYSSVVPGMSRPSLSSQVVLIQCFWLTLQW